MNKGSYMCFRIIFRKMKLEFIVSKSMNEYTVIIIGETV